MKASTLKAGGTSKKLQRDKEGHKSNIKYTGEWWLSKTELKTEFPHIILHTI